MLELRKATVFTESNVQRVEFFAFIKFVFFQKAIWDRHWSKLEKSCQFGAFAYSTDVNFCDFFFAPTVCIGRVHLHR